MRRLIHIILFVTCWAFSSVHADAQGSAGPVTVSVPGGQVAFNNLSLRFGYYGSSASGTITNSSPSEWGVLRFRVRAFDKKGRELPAKSSVGLVLIVFGLKANSTLGFGPNQNSATVGNVDGEPVRYELSLLSAERKATLTFAMVKPVESAGGVFADEFVEVRVTVEARVQLSLHNKTEHPIRIDWNEVMFVEPNGTAVKVLHEGVRLADKNNAGPPTTVPPMARLEDSLVPSDRVVWSDLLDRWEENPLFPSGESAAALDGKEFGLFLPIKVGDKTQNYSFRFRISVRY